MKLDLPHEQNLRVSESRALTRNSGTKNGENNLIRRFIACNLLEILPAMSM
jgi:hypothetical protein